METAKYLTKEQVKTLIAGAPAGVDKASIVKDLVEKRGYKLEGFNDGTTTSPVTRIGYSDTGADIKQVGTGISNAFKEAQTTANEAYASKAAGEQTGAEAFFQTIGAGAKALSNSAGEIVKGAVKVALPQEAETTIKQGIGAGVNAVSDLTSKYEELQKTKPVLAGALNIALGGTPGMALTAKDIINGYNELKTTNPRLAKNIDGALGIGQLAFDVATLGEGKAVATVAKDAAMTGAENVAKQTGKFASEAATKAGKATEGAMTKAKSSVLDFISPEVDAQTATILKETPSSVFDKAEKIAKDAALDPRKQSSFEAVGENLATATKKLEAMKNDVGARKSAFVESLAHGLDSFSTKTFSDKLVSLRNSLSLNNDKQIVDTLISRANETKTVRGADKLVDDIQEMLYRGKQDMTIPSGSSLEKQLKSLTSSLNTELKSKLPKEYSKLNSEYSQLFKATKSLNRSLGEVVDGVSTRGSGLVKQFFSPSGTKSKQLFQFIKDKTGIDIAQEATVAKFMAELHGDVRAKSLLEGLQPSASGITKSIIDFGVEKTGLGRKIKEASTEGTIKKARKLTKKSK